MKKTVYILIILSFSLLFINININSVNAQTYDEVQTALNYATFGNSIKNVNVDLSNTPHENNIIVACVSFAGYNTAIISLTTNNVTWTLKSQSEGHGNGISGFRSQIWVGVPNNQYASTVNIFSINPVGGIYNSFVASITEYSGVTLYDYSNITSFQGATGVNTANSGVIETLTQNNELIISAFSCIPNGLTGSFSQTNPTNDFTILNTYYAYMGTWGLGANLAQLQLFTTSQVSGVSTSLSHAGYYATSTIVLYTPISTPTPSPSSSGFISVDNANNNYVGIAIIVTVISFFAFIMVATDNKRKIV